MTKSNANGRKAATYYIVAQTAWVNDNGSIVYGNIPSRKAANELVAKLENKNTGNIKSDRSFMVMTQTEVNQKFGSEWWNATSDDYESFIKLTR